MLIYMNQPLRYDGKAFYQASYGKGDTLSILQVVSNPGWLLPYISCALITLGLLIALRHHPVQRHQAPPGWPGGRMKGVKLVHLAPGLLALAAVLAAAIAPGPVRGFDMDAFGRLPVLEGGRVKPLDSVARNALLMIRSKQSVPFQGRELGPDEWILDVLFRPRGGRRPAGVRHQRPGRAGPDGHEAVRQPLLQLQ